MESTQCHGWHPSSPRWAFVLCHWYLHVYIWRLWGNKLPIRPWCIQVVHLFMRYYWVTLFSYRIQIITCHNNLSYFSLDLVAMKWTLLRCRGEPPAYRDFHSATAIGDCMYVFGGRCDNGNWPGPQQNTEYYPNSVSYLVSKIYSQKALESLNPLWIHMHI